jgi:hypothetical protein
MKPSEIAAIILEAEGHAELGLFSEAWELVESLPPEVRLNESVVSVRLLVCAGLEKWTLGRELCRLIGGEHSLNSRAAAGGFLIAYADHLHAVGFRDTALSCIEALSRLWPEGRDRALGSAVMRADWV